MMKHPPPLNHKNPTLNNSKEQSGGLGARHRLVLKELWVTFVCVFSAHRLKSSPLTKTTLRTWRMPTPSSWLLVNVKLYVPHADKLLIFVSSCHCEKYNPPCDYSHPRSLRFCMRQIPGKWAYSMPGGIIYVPTIPQERNTRKNFWLCECI
jgi:hypothetical protein